MKRTVFCMGLIGFLSCVGAMAAGRSVAVSSTVNYQDQDIIPGNILSECGQLGSSFSSSTEKYLRDNGWQVSALNGEPAAGTGKQLKLQVANAFSAGNAFTGHRKSVSIIAELYEDGQLVDTYRQTRNSSGGFAGGFKGSCSVLYRCTNTLGNDVAKWMADK